MLERVHRYKEKTPLFEGTGVDAEIRSTLNRRVDLPSGGYLIFDYAEAFTVVDVNTGRFVGSRSKNSTGRLEDTITKNNLEAVKEVVRQLRLRDIGGIIVIDFIDMANPKNRATVEEALRTELERDRTKTYVVEISPLGLVEMTRQNVTDGPREILTKKCPTCAGDGIVLSEASAALEVERRLRVLAAGSRAQAFRVEVSPRVASLLLGPGGSRLAEIEEASKKRFFLVPKEGVHADHAAVLAEGKLADLQPESPVAEGVGGRGQARRARQARRRVRRRQARRHRRRRRRRREARRQEGEGSHRPRPRRHGLRDAARRRREAGRADHVRERGREADARAEPCEEDDRVRDRDRGRVEVEAEADAEVEAEVEEPEVGEVELEESTRGDDEPEDEPAEAIEAEAGETPVKKKTRRGSRGGRQPQEEARRSGRRGRRRRRPRPRRRPRRVAERSRSDARPLRRASTFRTSSSATPARRSRRASAP